MKRIAYIELDTHAEIAQNFMHLMKNDKDFEVDYYFSERIIKRIGKHQSNVFLTESTVLLGQLNQQSYDLVIIGTVHRYFNLFNEIAKKFHTSVLVHNLNFCTISRFELFKNIIKNDFKYRLKLWLKEDLLAASSVFKNAKSLLVLDESLAKGHFKYVPLFFNQFQMKSDSETLTVVIPGAVSQQRRDYKKVLRYLSANNQINQPLKIIFLGQAQDKELRWLKDFENLKSNTISIQYFTQKVPQNIFDEWMNKADLLWCPIQSETQFFSHKEIYGETKMSGNIGDAIKYGKFALFPENYQSEYNFIINEKDNVIDQIFSVRSYDSYDFQEKFNQEKITADLKSSLKSLL